jgi:hypothetical protein
MGLEATDPDRTQAREGKKTAYTDELLAKTKRIVNHQKAAGGRSCDGEQKYSHSGERPT